MWVTFFRLSTGTDKSGGLTRSWAARLVSRSSTPLHTLCGLKSSCHMIDASGTAGSKGDRPERSSLAAIHTKVDPMRRVA